MRYTDTMVTFREVPDEVSLCINISGCPNHCPDCHSKELWNEVGRNFTTETISDLVYHNDGITCVCFMGGDAYIDEIKFFIHFIKNNYPLLKTCWYTGQNRTEESLSDILPYLDYIKTGPYIDSCGPLNNPNTNQRFYKVENKKMIDITNIFWK